MDGCEISYSNLKKIVSGASAPSPDTVLRIVSLLPRTSRSPSTLAALFNSYPHVLARVIIGLDVLGLEATRERFRDVPQVQRQIERGRLQARIGLRGFRAIQSVGEQSSRKALRRAKPVVRLERWITDLVEHFDLFAIAIAYCYFSTPFWDRESAALYSVLNRYDAAREALYAVALRRYADFNKYSDAYAGPTLDRAEQILTDCRIARIDRIAMVSPLFGAWAGLFAESFIASVPLLKWVDDETLRENLGFK